MQYSTLTSHLSTRAVKRTAFILALLCSALSGAAQNTPLLSGGVAFLTETNNGNTFYTPIIEPLLAAPIGQHLLIESRATFAETWAPGSSSQPGYGHAKFIALTYLQGDYIASPHLTVVGGSFLLPFGTYNERLTPLWISNFQDGPASVNIGTFATGVGLGGQLRGSVIARRKYSVAYAAYFSARSGNAQFQSERSSGGRVSLYLPDQRLEVGASYGRLLQGKHENFFGTHLWWEPANTGFQLRSEFNRGEHSQGYWAEFAYRTKAFGGENSFIGRFEPLFRMQQTFRVDNSANTDGVSSVNTQRADFGLDYNLPHNTRIQTSYARQFSSFGNHNVWETGIIYRFLFPAWKGK